MPEGVRIGAPAVRSSCGLHQGPSGGLRLGASCRLRLALVTKPVDWSYPYSVGDMYQNEQPCSRLSCECCLVDSRNQNRASDVGTGGM
jgi:hypothetical protein